MGDPTIAEQLREGVREAIATLGQSVSISRSKRSDARDPEHPTRRPVVVETPVGIDPEHPNQPVEALIAAFEESLIDGEVVKQGDLRMTVLANGLSPPTIGDTVHLVSRVGQDLSPRQDTTLRIVARSSTVVSGEDVSYTFVLRQ